MKIKRDILQEQSTTTRTESDPCPIQYDPTEICIHYFFHSQEKSDICLKLIVKVSLFVQNPPGKDQAGAVTRAEPHDNHHWEHNLPCPSMPTAHREDCLPLLPQRHGGPLRLRKVGGDRCIHRGMGGYTCGSNCIKEIGSFFFFYIIKKMYLAKYPPPFYMKAVHTWIDG